MLKLIDIITNNYFLKQKLKVTIPKAPVRRLTDNWQGSTKSGKRIGRLFPKALRLHPLNISLWVKAAEWECNGNQSFDTARILLTRGLRLNKGNPTLYRELFELELSFASIIKERRRILGLDNSAAETSVENEAISETKLSIPQLPGEDDDYDAGNGTKSNNKNKIQEDGKIKMIQGRMATIVFNNAIQKIQDSNECIQFALDARTEMEKLREQALNVE